MSDDKRLIRSLLGPAGPELTCDECFEQLDRFVELEIEGRDADEGVPIDVLAERLGSNRNALYKLLHDARRRLRSHIVAAGFPEVNQ